MHLKHRHGGGNGTGNGGSGEPELIGGAGAEEFNDDISVVSSSLDLDLEGKARSMLVK